MSNIYILSMPDFSQCMFVFRCVCKEISCDEYRNLSVISNILYKCIKFFCYVSYIYTLYIHIKQTHISCIYRYCVQLNKNKHRTLNLHMIMYLLCIQCTNYHRVPNRVVLPMYTVVFGGASNLALFILTIGFEHKGQQGNRRQFHIDMQ